MSKALTLGIVGAGAVVQRAHLPVLLNMPEVRIAWITDAREDIGRQTADANRLRFVPLPDSPRDLPDCDAALLATPVTARDAYCQALGERGIAVLSEKPFAITYDQHERFERPFSPSRIACGYVRRMYASSVLLRRIMEEGWFGPCHRISVSEGSHVTRTGMDSTPKGEDHRRGGGITLNIGCHLIDLALHLTGATAYSIVETNPVWDGACDRKMAARIRLENIHGRDGEHCELAFAVSWLDQLDNRIDLEFEHVTVSAGIVPDARVTLRGSNDTHPGGVLSLPGPGAETFHQAFFLEWQAFLRGLERNEPSLISASSGRLTTRLIEQLLREGAPA